MELTYEGLPSFELASLPSFSATKALNLSHFGHSFTLCGSL
uniref:Uncharacterized protein n=1 Tax=Rhizophora mucronata TaxID=61149 RepID=A0A2P2ILH2_RHIMU